VRCREQLKEGRERGNAQERGVLAARNTPFSAGGDKAEKKEFADDALSELAREGAGSAAHRKV